MIELTESEITRFWSKIDRSEGCWTWTGEINNQGYGRFVVWRSGRRIRLLAHRLAYRLTTGVDLGSRMARHRCDNPPCCNPDDLSPGTQVDNMRDAAERGRVNRTGLDLGRARNRADAVAVLESGRKFCAGCEQTRPLDNFHRSSRTLHGRQSRCKDCSRRTPAQIERRRMQERAARSKARAA